MAIWTISEEVVSLYLYINAGRKVASATSPLTKRISKLSGKSIGSVILKTANFRSLDPLSKSKGMENVSYLDRYVWSRYGSNVSELSKLALRILRMPSVIIDEFSLGSINAPKNYNIPNYFSKTKRRIGQDRIHAMALHNYESKCCICGIEHPDILRASHIVPWSKRADTRGDPKNVLCLCSLHDSLFDSGLMSIRDDYTLMLSEELRGFPETLSAISNLEGRKITLPINRRANPLPEYLAYHRNFIYRISPASKNNSRQFTKEAVNG